MFATRLKELRKNKGLTQTALANLFAISNGAVGNWETGLRQPDHDTLTKIADFFDVSIDYLLGRTDEPSPSSPTLDKQLEGIDFALYGETKDLTDAEKEKILDFIRFTKSQRK